MAEGRAASRRRNDAQKGSVMRRQVCPTCGHVTTTVVADTTIARAIFGRRQEGGLTLRDAARAAGVSTSTLCRIERGKMPDVENAVKIAAWLGESLDALFRPRAVAPKRPTLRPRNG